MSSKSISIKYLSDNDFAFSLSVREGRRLNHVFHKYGDTLDVSGLVTLDELDANEELIRLVESGLFAVVSTEGSTDFTPSPAAGTSIQEYTHTIESGDMLPFDDVTINAQPIPDLPGNIFILACAFSKDEEFVGGPSSATIFVGRDGQDHELMEEREMIDGQNVGDLYTAVNHLSQFYWPGPPNGSTNPYTPVVSIQGSGSGSFANLTAGKVTIHIYYLQILPVPVLLS